MSGNRGFISLPWQLNWVQTVVFESLNFSVLAALCIVCRPTGITQMHACMYVCICTVLCFVCMTKVICCMVPNVYV